MWRCRARQTWRRSRCGDAAFMDVGEEGTTTAGGAWGSWDCDGDGGLEPMTEQARRRRPSALGEASTTTTAARSPQSCHEDGGRTLTVEQARQRPSCPLGGAGMAAVLVVGVSARAADQPNRVGELDRLPNLSLGASHAHSLVARFVSERATLCCQIRQEWLQTRRLFTRSSC